MDAKTEQEHRKLMAAAKAVDLQAHDLDEVVSELYADRASEVNNLGVEYQILELVKYGWGDQAQAIIEGVT